MKRAVQQLTGLSLSPSQLSAFERFEQELMDWNSRINLTAIREAEEIRNKHFVELAELFAGLA